MNPDFTLCFDEALIIETNKGTKAINPIKKFISAIAIKASSPEITAAKFG